MPDLKSQSDSPYSQLGLPEFSCSWKSDGLDAAWVHVAGELDLSTVGPLRQTLAEAVEQARLIVVDLRALSFMDSSGLHTLVDVTQRARETGRRVVLVRPPPIVNRIFDITGTKDCLEIDTLSPAEPPVQVLLTLAQQDTA